MNYFNKIKPTIFFNHKCLFRDFAPHSNSKWIHGLIGSGSIAMCIYYYYKYTLYNVENVVSEDNTPEKKPEVRYEDKYIDKFETLHNEFHFKTTSNVEDKFNQLISNYKQELCGLQNEYAEMENYYNCTDDESEEEEELDEEMEELENKIHSIQKILKEENNYAYIRDKAVEECYQEDKKFLLQSLENNYVIETTPVGNVVMFYNFKKEGFSYYSDKSISNQYLDVVCRKYILQFMCKPLFQNKKYICEGKLSNFKFIKNEIKNTTKKNAKMTFADFKKKLTIF